MASTETIFKRAEVRAKVKACTSCDLHNHCKSPVPFAGTSTPKLVVVGEAPGRQEDEAGEPFIGPAGQLLRKWLAEVGWDIEREVAFVNAVSCFPHRTPSPEEVAACQHNVVSQLSFLRCNRLLVVGGIATSSLIKTSVRMGEIRGLWFRPEIDADGKTWAFATWHPAAVLRNRTLEFEATDDISYQRLMIKYDKEPVLGMFCVKCGSPKVQYRSDIPFCDRHLPKVTR